MDIDDSPAALDVLARNGWRLSESHVADPIIAAYWQRWEGPSDQDWVELPHDMPAAIVLRTIEGMPALGRFYGPS